MITGYLNEVSQWLGTVQYHESSDEKEYEKQSCQLSVNGTVQELEPQKTEEVWTDGIRYTVTDTAVFDGSQYVDIGFLADSDTKIEIEAELKNFSKYVFGARSDSRSGDQFGLYFGWSSSFVQFGSSFTADLSMVVRNRTYRFELSKEGLKIDGKLAFKLPSINFSGGCSLCIGGCNTGGNIDNRLLMGSVAYVKIYEKDSLKMMLQPMKNEQNDFVFLDCISGKIYKTAKLKTDNSTINMMEG